MRTILFTVEGCKANNNEAVTRDGCRVHIVGYNNPLTPNCKYQLTGYVASRVYPHSWTEKGRNASLESPFDLFLPAPEPKLRLWTIKEVPHLAMIRNIGDTENYGTIVGVTNLGHINIAGVGNLLVCDIVNFYEHSTDHGLTWNPCGVAE